MGFCYNLVSRCYGFFARRWFKRPFLVECIRRFRGKPVVGVEVGVADGFNARMFLRHLNIERLYLVDPYVDGFEGHFDRMRKRLSRWEDRIVVIRKKGIFAIDSIDEKLDFVYIDDDHHFDSVFNHIDLYVEKLRRGGLIGGHDFNIPDVARAVTEFASKYDINVCVNNPLVKVDWFYGEQE